MIPQTPLAAARPAGAAAPEAQTLTPEREAALRATARDFEASFLSQMLKHAGLGETRESFGGGAGEDAFASLLADEQARLLADRGGIGLAESIFRALARREGGS